MITSLIHINIEYENGLYAMDDKATEVLDRIPDEIDIITPFFNEENNLEEIEDAILMEDGDDLIITWSKGSLALALELAGDLAGVYAKNVYIPMEILEEDRVVSFGEGNVIYVKDVSKIDSSLENGHKEHWLGIPSEYIAGENPVNGDRYFTTMKNGYDAFVSGVYPQQITNSFAKHVLVNDKEADLKSYVDINSAVFSKEKLHTSDPAYCHKHVIEEGKIRFDNSSCALERTVLNYREYLEKRALGLLKHGHEYILKLESSEDYKAFESDLKDFEEKGLTDTYERRLVDECRWSNECSLKRMLRFSEKKGEIYPCLTSKESIGKIGDDYDQIITNANCKCDRAIINRKCMVCSEHDRCSGCAMLPEGFSEIDFCGFMRKHRLIREFIHRQHVAAYLAQFSSLFSGDEFIRFSVPGNRFFYPGDEDEKQEIFLSEKNGQYIYLNLRTGSLIKVEQKYVFLLEAWAEGSNLDSQIMNISLVFGFDPGSAQEAVVVGNRKLKNGGMIL